MHETKQEDFWKSDFGKEYTERNTYTVEGFDEFYKKTWGITRSQMNQEFLDGLDRNIRILEVGCNIGLQLRHLQKMGFNNLYGIELQWYAIEKAKELTRNISIIQGSALDLPFKDGWFELVYTSGVLIHIAPEDSIIAVKEICRVSSAYVWGFEYYDDELKEIEYRGNKGFLWKRDFCKLYTDHCPELSVVKRVKYPYTEGNNVDEMFLLKKN